MSKWGELWMAELEERRLLVSGAQGGAALAQAWGWFLWVAVDRKSDTKLCFSFTLKKSKAISCCINSSCHRKALQAQEDRESLQEPAGMDWRRFPLELVVLWLCSWGSTNVPWMCTGKGERSWGNAPWAGAFVPLCWIPSLTHPVQHRSSGWDGNWRMNFPSSTTPPPEFRYLQKIPCVQTHQSLLCLQNGAALPKAFASEFLEWKCSQGITRALAQKC